MALTAAPATARKTGDLMEMETEQLFELSLEELLDREISSAGKMVEKVGDIPASVHIVTREEIETYGYRTLSEAIENIPGFYAVYDYWDDIVGVRGVLNEGNIIFLVNGVAQHVNEISEIMVPTDAIDRIEVVRGPMSVIHGSGAFLGSINIVTDQPPPDAPPSRISVTAGDGGVREGFLRTGGGDGDVRFTLNATAYRSDGIEADYRGMIGGDIHDWILRNHPEARLRTDGTLEQKNWNLNLSGRLRRWYGHFQYNRSDNGVFEGISFHDGSAQETEITTLQAGHRRHLTDTVVLDGKVTFSRFQDDERYDVYPPSEYGPEALGGSGGDEDRLEVELDVIWRPAETFNLVAGLHSKTIRDTAYRIHLPAPMDAPDGEIRGRYRTSDRETRSVFAQANYAPWDPLRLTLGARLEQYMSFESRAYVRYGEDAYPSTDRFNTGERIYAIPRAAAVWTPSDGHIVKLMYGEANKPFSALDIAIIELEKGILRELAPEEIETMEVNYLVSHGPVGLSLSLFRNNIENLRTVRLEATEGGDIVPVRDNSGRMVSVGGEAILTARPTPCLNLELSAAYQETEDRTGGDLSLSHSPRLLAKVKAEYRRGSWTLGVSGRYVDDMDPHRPLEVPASFDLRSSDDSVVFDANLRYVHARSGLFAAVHVANLLDGTVRYPATENALFRYGLLDEGRRISGTVGWTF